MQKNQYGVISLATTALVLPLTVFIGTLVNLVLKTRNSQNINIASEGAYQQPVLATTAVLFIILTIASIVFAIIGLKKSSESALSKVSLALITVIILLAIGGFFIQKQTNTVESDYRKTQLNEFLKKFSQ